MGTYHVNKRVSENTKYYDKKALYLGNPSPLPNPCPSIHNHKHQITSHILSAFPCGAAAHIASRSTLLGD